MTADNTNTARRRGTKNERGKIQAVTKIQGGPTTVNSVKLLQNLISRQSQSYLNHTAAVTVTLNQGE